MTNGITVKRKFQCAAQGGATTHKRALLAARVQRVSRLMALAIRFEQLIQKGVVATRRILQSSAASRGLAYRRF